MSIIMVNFTMPELVRVKSAVYAQRDKCFDKMNEMSNTKLQHMKAGEWSKEMEDEFRLWYKYESDHKDKWNDILTVLEEARDAKYNKNNPFVKEA